MTIKCILIAVLLAVAGRTEAQTPPGPPTVALWPQGAPGSEERRAEPEIVENTYVRNVHQPSLTVFRADPAHANGAAVIVVPGGGHRMLVWVNEGVMPARMLNRFGVTAFVLTYRLAREAGSNYDIARDAAADARRAVRWVRAHAAEYGVDPHRVGLMGFSAGGELVSMVADAPAPPTPANADTIDRLSARPDFQVLVYPGPLGIPATAAVGAPPAFLVAGTLDQCCAVPVLTLYQQLRTAGVSVELHLFADTDHAFNVGMHSERLGVAHWPDRLADWLSDGGWLRPGGGAKPAPGNY
ncbi:alpha/beta hydrolase [Polymorphobacter sp. PAMC 29334]|uniref:alpha/beta hydrolase n=1 Tax=Polymorphobacter sp. PAMC 29334 TaxID=2862331 RepID=UPI001C6679B1|nr:alpha/beta hydrolase [Polymorphobacter sp. PAMC 29334]QYE36573.1 alpha/beta hydrolase [Polymorphobacter sp. PAMC 29334]